MENKIAQKLIFKSAGPLAFFTIVFDLSFSRPAAGTTDVLEASINILGISDYPGIYRVTHPQFLEPYTPSCAPTSATFHLSVLGGAQEQFPPECRWPDHTEYNLYIWQ
ncbi:MAG: hypothetical protein K9K82_11270 [Desulfobacteraceae bacterium]|nr:hypothetical protein [Desulfobacteraceae bacterium]